MGIYPVILGMLISCAVAISAGQTSSTAHAFRVGKLPDDFVLSPDFNIAETMFQPVIRSLTRRPSSPTEPLEL